MTYKLTFKDWFKIISYVVTEKGLVALALFAIGFALIINEVTQLNKPSLTIGVCLFSAGIFLPLAEYAWTARGSIIGLKYPRLT